MALTVKQREAIESHKVRRVNSCKKIFKAIINIIFSHEKTTYKNISKYSALSYTSILEDHRKDIDEILESEEIAKIRDIIENR